MNGSKGTACAARLLSLLLLLALPAVVQAQFTFTTNNDGSLNIFQYTGSGGDVTIPDTTNGLSVTSIGDGAFSYNYTLSSVTIPSSVTNIGDSAFSNTSLTNVIISDGVTRISAFAFDACNNLRSVTIPDSVTTIELYAFSSCFSLMNVTLPDRLTSIGPWAFASCYSLTNVTIPGSVTNIDTYAFLSCIGLTAITVNPLNSVYSSIDGVVFDKTQTTLILCPAGKTGNYTIPDGVTNIAESAFESSSGFGMSGLTSVTIPSSVTSIGDFAFISCAGLTGIYSLGNAPTNVGAYVFYGDDNATVYYLPETTGWDNFAQLTGLPTVLWLPRVQNDSSFGVQTNQFGFNINWASDMTVVVEASTDLANPNWSPVGTNTLTGGTSYFSDSQWTNYPARFYRLRSP